jgi:hypothetical protein
VRGRLRGSKAEAVKQLLKGELYGYPENGQRTLTLKDRADSVHDTEMHIDIATGPAGRVGKGGLAIPLSVSWFEK